MRKLRLISKFITSQTGQQRIAIQISSIISRSKSIQTITFGQLIEHNMKNVFLKSFTQNMVEKLFPDRFIYKKLNINLD